MPSITLNPLHGFRILPLAALVLVTMSAHAADDPSVWSFAKPQKTEEQPDAKPEPPRPAKNRKAKPASSLGTPMGDYVLQAGDVIRMQVFQEPDLDRELPVSNGGLITGVPLLGAVPVKGLTVAQAEAEIARRYDADYLVDPQITITVLRYSEQRVKVLGAVNSPGLIVVPPSERMTLIDAIARAGDFNRLADHRHVRVTRTGADGEITNYVVDVDTLRAGGPSPVVVLERDDIVVVPESRL